MKWKEALYTLNKDRMFNPQEIEALLKLPEIRDLVFFPDYKKYGYISLETNLADVNVSMEMLKIEINLVSIDANRKLTLAFVFQKKDRAENGVISDAIFVLDKKEGWDIMIDMDVLIKKRAEHNSIYDYWRLSSYPGSFEEKIIACLKQIKYNYDTYAKDIISGENWDPTAHDNSYI